MPNTKTYIGADLHKKTCYVTVMNKDGKIRKQKEIGTDTLTIAKFFKRYNGSKVAVESTMNWMPFYENLESLGLKVNFSNPLQTKAIASAKIKNDKVDSKVLADLLRTNMLPLAYIQPRKIRDFKEIIRQRAHYVELRTRIKNKISAYYKKLKIKKKKGVGIAKVAAARKLCTIVFAVLTDQVPYQEFTRPKKR